MDTVMAMDIMDTGMVTMVTTVMDTDIMDTMDATMVTDTMGMAIMDMDMDIMDTFMENKKFSGKFYKNSISPENSLDLCDKGAV